MLYKIYFSSHKFAFSNLRFFAILRAFSSITRKICVQIKNKVHHVNQLKEPDLMMYTHMPFSKKKPLHSTYLLKIFFSLLTLSTAFLQKACAPGNKLKQKMCGKVNNDITFIQLFHFTPLNYSKYSSRC